jgi:hypothetical protein
LEYYCNKISGRRISSISGKEDDTQEKITTKEFARRFGFNFRCIDNAVRRVGVLPKGVGQKPTGVRGGRAPNLYGLDDLLGLNVVKRKGKKA